MKQTYLSQHRNSALFLWLLPLLVAGAVFFFSSQDGDESTVMSNGFILFLVDHLRMIIPPWQELTDQELLTLLSTVIRKGAHVTEHLILYLSLFPAMKASHFRLIPLKALLVTFLNACSDEFHQLFVPGRHGCFTDVLIDCSGAAVLTLILILVLHHRAGASHNP